MSEWLFSNTFALTLKMSLVFLYDSYHYHTVFIQMKKRLFVCFFYLRRYERISNIFNNL